MSKNEAAPDSDTKFVSRGGIKLQHALDEFALDVTDNLCADFGCSVGGFTDCLLQNAAAHVHAIDTAYGILDYRLRIDERVTVHERTNILHFPPEKIPPDGVDLVVIDAGWTTQLHILPVAQNWLRPDGKIITLIKPHYEWKNMPAHDAAQIGAPIDQRDQTTVLEDDLAAEVCRFVVQTIEARLPLTSLGVMPSPIRGGGKRHRKKKAGSGNIEYLALLTPRTDT